MKKLIALMLVLMMCMPILAHAEDAVIGGADGPTSLFVTGKTESLGEAALAAGRRIDTVLTLTPLTGVQTGEPMIDNAIADLIDALALRFSQQGDEGEVALSFSGTDVLNLGAMISEKDCYINSNLLGGTIVINAEEVEPLLGRLLDMFVLMEAMTAEDAAQIKVILAEAMVSIEQSMASAEPELEEMNLSALEQAFAFALERVEPVENPVVPRMCDAAVSGVQLTFDNAEMVQAVKYIYQFLLDNPVLLTYMSTEMEITADDVQQAMAEIDQQTLLNGEMVVAVYNDEQDQIVYAVLNLPLANGAETDQLDAAYTRQTVAAGTAHVVNITVNGETLTIDALAGAESTVVNLVDPNGSKLMDLTILNGAENTLDVTLNLYEEEAQVLAAHVTGECEYTDVREYFAGVLTLTLYEEGQSIPLVFQLVSDYAVNGVDFNGVAGVSFEGLGVGFGLQMASQTTDAKESIMAGNVTRPAELDEASFQQWFVDVVNGVMLTLSNAMSALPESVLALLMMPGN